MNNGNKAWTTLDWLFVAVVAVAAFIALQVLL
jgi:hypothetical protein